VPICSFVKLNPNDGFAYLKRKFNLTNDNILSEIKADFKSYSNFTKTIFRLTFSKNSDRVFLKLKMKNA